MYNDKKNKKDIQTKDDKDHKDKKDKEKEISSNRPISFPFTYEKVSKKDLKKLEKNHKKSWD